MDIATLLSSSILVMILYSCHYLWRHRRYYNLMRKFTGPPPLPIIGNLLMFHGNTGFFGAVARLAAENASPAVIWNSLLMPVVLIFDPENVQIVSNNCVDRQSFGVLKGFGANGLLGASVSRWKKLRSSHDQCFGSQYLVKYLDAFNAKSGIWIDRLESFATSGEIVDIWDIVLDIHAEMIVENMTGYELKSLGLKVSEFAKSQSMVMKLCTQRLFTKPWLYSDTLLKFYLLYTGENRFFKSATEFTRTILEAKRKDDSTGPANTTPITDDKERRPKNCLDSVFKVARKYPELANLNDMHEDLWSILTAGTDTTAITLCLAFLMLAIHEDVQQRVYEEIMSVFDKEDRPVQMKDLNKLKYVEQCLKETLRRFTLAPFINRRITSDTILSNKLILPKGAFVMMYMNPLNHDSRVYAHPDAWNPEHFADENADKYEKSFFPFGTGSRRCMGYKYAMVDMKTQIVYVLRKYKLTTNVTMEQIKFVSDFVTRSKNGYPIRFHCRNE